MNLTVVKYKKEYRKQIIDIWEQSVRATHLFIKAEDVIFYKGVIDKIDFNLFKIYCVLSEDSSIAGFIALKDNDLEMLFLDPHFMGQGIGKILIEYAINELNITTILVNEENKSAVHFYKKHGFQEIERRAIDGYGKPYPILKMKLVKG